ncbi:PASTA domain-containing protein [Streptomyces sp. NBC_00285]|uniref:PASTA domain-containing protein n=1 Tax=Streptomyces sp. NBC_00285 TaxID=2975700 RepID=UPI002E2A2CCF|nr:PASTA domain-containing protein [Streptomyces sp. NBC_00285]
MTLRAFMHRIALLAIFTLLVSGCDHAAPVTAVKAVAAHVPSLAPFFDENSGLGQDAAVRSRAVQGSLQQGDTPGLYGGSKQPTICDVAKLERFLTDPRNHKKAQAWAHVLNIGTDGIPEYLDRLTPVLLRHDTLVENHDYKKEKAVPYNSLLQTGIAILVDEQGLPAVKCSCGNPLRPFKGDTSRISVHFDGGNKKWAGYERDAVVAVKPAPRKLERIALVDVREPARGIARPTGTTGEKDTTFDTKQPRAVPDLTGTTFAHARRELIDAGLAAGYAGRGVPPDSAKVTASDPPAGAELPFGQFVTLTVAGGGTSTTGGVRRPTTTPPPRSSSAATKTPPTGTPSSARPSGSSGSSGKPGKSSSAPPSSSSSKPGKPSSPPSSSTAPASPSPAKSSRPPSPPPSTRSSPAGTPHTSSAPPASPPSKPPPSTTGAPVTGEPASGDPTTTRPADGPSSSVAT